MGLTADVQQLLETIQNDPDASLLLNRKIPASLVREVRKYVSADAERFGMRELDDLLGKDHLPWKLENFYRAVLSIGVEDKAALRRFLLQFVQAEYGTGPAETHLLDKEKRLYVLCRSAVEREVSQNYELEYAVNNHLCYHSDQQWLVTRLGQALLRSSELQATRFLLTLEMFLNSGKWDEWHMSREFLEDIHKTGSSMNRFPPGDEFDPGPPRIWEEYLERLRQFELASDAPEEEISQYVTSLTKTGKVIIESVLVSESAYDALIPLFVNQELDGVHPELSLSASRINRMRSILQDSRWLGDLRQPILTELDRLSRGDDPFSVFKALVPCVEGILKKIIAYENLSAPKKDMDGYIQTIKGASNEVLKGGTLQMIDKVIRPDRNITQHGEIIAPEPARMLCEVTLAVIEQVHKEYEDYQENKR